MYLKEKIDKCNKISDHIKKRLYIVGIITELLSKADIRPVLVGGGALEFYTFGSYATVDVDLVVAGTDKLKEVLDKLEFCKGPGQRHWYNPKLDIAIEVPDNVLAGDEDRIREVGIDDMKVYIIGIEDLILDRLRAYKFWKSSLDGEWAGRLMAIHKDDIDWDYLEVSAKKENVYNALMQVKKVKDI